MFKIIDRKTEYKTTIKKSKFYCFCYFVDNKNSIERILNELWKQFPDASHICYAYILDDTTYHYSDDGEPSGSAGIPIFNAIKSFNLNYCLVCVVRYFGGIKFGPGPLRQTFKEIATETLKLSSILNACLKDVIEVEIPLSESKKYINNFSNLLINKKYSIDSVVLTITGNKEELVSRLLNSNLKILSIKERQIIKI